LKLEKRDKKTLTTEGQNMRGEDKVPQKKNGPEKRHIARGKKKGKVGERDDLHLGEGGGAGQFLSLAKKAESRSSAYT